MFDRSRVRTFTVARLALAAALTALVAAAAPALAAPVPGAQDWPMFHRDPHHTGYSSETTLTASNVGPPGGLGIEWMVNTGQATNNSPAVVYNAQLDKTIVYTASKNHVVSAYDAMTGARIWYFEAAAELNSSPAVVDGVVYIGSDDYKLYALNATTGALICSFNTGGIINASPVVGDPGGGKVVYFADSGIGGASDGGHIWAVNAVDPNAAADCSLKWSYDQFGEPPGSQPNAGAWSPPAFATTATGRKLVVVGSSSPDNSAYAFDANTGARVWRFQTEHTALDADVGAGPTISPPGVNGFADGLAYVIGKSHIFYALNLSTGAMIWEFDMNVDSPNFVGSTRSTPALVGNRIYVGYGEGLYALNAVTGAKVWKFNTDTRQEVVSSPAVTGPAGGQVVFFTDLSGRVYAVDAATGTKKWSYDTGGYSYSSPAVWNGNVYVGSSDGFLYEFGLGGGASAKPTTTITSPADRSSIPNPPNGILSITGTAADDRAVSQVLVAVKQHTGNKWWNASTQLYEDVFVTNPATLTSPGATSTDWSFSVPVSKNGGLYTIQAEAVDNDGQHTAPVALSRITVASTGNPPETTITEPRNKQVFPLPDPAAPIPITVKGTATDNAGANPGVKEVNLFIVNIEHSEYYCGSPGCGGSTSYYTTAFTKIVIRPPAPTSPWNWSYTFYTMDHAHNYRIQAQAVDLDKEKDPTKAKVSPVCVRVAGQSCAGAVG